MKAFQAAPVSPVAHAWLFGRRAGAAARAFIGAALLAAAGAVAFAGLQWWHARAALASSRSAMESERHAALDAEQAARRIASSSTPTAAERVAANRVVRQLNAPWGSLFNTLERHADRSVAVLALESDAERDLIRLTTEGRSAGDLLRHAAALQAEPLFAQVQLMRIEDSGAEEGVPGPNTVRLVIEMKVAR